MRLDALRSDPVLVLDSSTVAVLCYANPMAFKFCPECGLRTEPGARFCSSCGQAFRTAGAALPLAGIVSLAALVLLGGGFWLYQRYGPEPVRPLKPGEGVAAANPGAGAARPADAHPPFELPEDIRQYIAKIGKDAEAKPKDAEAWALLARVLYRASRVDPTYTDKAQEAFEHLHGIDPKNLEGLRGLGNLAYDRADRGKAIEYYQAYLDVQPDDAEVRTDLGTMRYESGDAEGAIKEFERVIAKTPSFYQAYFNLGVVYDARGERTIAHEQLRKARDAATEPAVKQRIDTLLAAAEKSGGSLADAAAAAAQTASAAGPATAPPGAPAGLPSADPMDAAAAAASAAVAAAPQSPPVGNDFPSTVESVFRSAPVAGPKVAKVEWPEPRRARVVMDGFPMAGMPDVMRNRFLDRLKSGVTAARQRFSVSESVTVEIVDQASGDVMEKFVS
jgi:cytochrome c-type biogenesis protein CcmH/NrfG